MRSTRTVLQSVLGVVLALALIPMLAAQSVVGTITRPNMNPTAVAVDEVRNRVFVADENSQKLYMYDGVTHAELNSIPTGRLVYKLVVSQAARKLYVLVQSSGALMVVDLATFAPITTFSGFYAVNGLLSDIQLDAGLGKLYAMSAMTGLYQIDVNSDVEVAAPGVSVGTMTLNPVTHEVFVAESGGSGVLFIVNGSTLAVTTAFLPFGYGLGVNWLENKVYSGWPGNGIYNRVTGQVTPIGIGFEQNDAEAFTFNPASNRMYTDVEISNYTTTIDGPSDATWDITFGVAAAAPVVLTSTNHVYFGGMNATFVVEDSSQMMKVLPVSNPSGGGLLIQAIAANQTTGRVYVVNDASLSVVTVIQDAPTNCTSSLSPANVVFPAGNSYPQDILVTASPGCSWGLALPSPDIGDTGAWIFDAGGPIHTGSGTLSLAAWPNDSSASRTMSGLIAGKPFTATQTGAPALTVTKTHSGNFAPGQVNATYTVTVSNGPGAGPTNDMMVVTETLPAGLTMVSMAGSGWGCASNVCSRSEPLAGGTSFPAITVTVNVAANAASPQINQVSVSAGGSAGASATDSTTIAAPGMAFFAGSVNGGGGTQYLQFPNGKVFGYYAFLSSNWMFHVDLGYEYVIPGNGPEVYLWDLSSGEWWYTNASSFPYLYDFTRNAWIYYFPDTNKTGHYTTNPRWFVNMTTGVIFTM